MFANSVNCDGTQCDVQRVLPHRMASCQSESLHWSFLRQHSLRCDMDGRLPILESPSQCPSGHAMDGRLPIPESPSWDSHDNICRALQWMVFHQSWGLHSHVTALECSCDIASCLTTQAAAHLEVSCHESPNWMSPGDVIQGPTLNAVTHFGSVSQGQCPSWD